MLQEGVAHPVGTDGVLLGTWADVSGARSILDIGTGTGLIALMLAQRTGSDTAILAIDLHPGSVVCAAQNFKNAPWKERLTLQERSVQQFTRETTQCFDLIVSNPPFFSETTVPPDAARRLGRYAGSLSNADLLESVNQLLAPKGKCCLVLPEKEGKRLCEMAVPLGLYCTRELGVRTRVGKPVERLLLQLERDPGRFQRETLELYNAEGAHSGAYKKLTSDYYLNF